MDGIQHVSSTRAGSPLYHPSAGFVSMRLGSLDDLHSLNLGIMSAAHVRREEFMVTDHGVALTNRTW
jgi:hypothetical protein